MPGEFTEYVVIDETNEIKCKVHTEEAVLHNFDKGDKVSLIGKLFGEENEIKLGVHHIALNQTESRDYHKEQIKYLKLTRQYDELINDLRQNQPFLYELHINKLGQKYNKYQNEKREKKQKYDQQNMNQQHGHYNNENAQFQNDRQWQSNNNYPRYSSNNKQSNRISNNFNCANGQNNAQIDYFSNNQYYDKTNYQNNNAMSTNHNNQWNNGQNYANANSNLRNNANAHVNYQNESISNQNQRERANSFSVNNANFNQYGILEPNSQNMPRRRRRESAPNAVNNGNGGFNDNHLRGRKGVIYEKMRTLFNLKKNDISIQDLMKTVSFNASVEEVKNHLYALQHEGHVYSTHDEFHWRPVYG